MFSSFMISVAVIFVAVLSPASVIARPPSSSARLATKTATKNTSNSKLEKINPVKESNPMNVQFITAQLKKTINRLIDGVKTIPKNMIEAERLKKIKKKGGQEALTFKEYHFLEKAQEDFYKLFKVVAMIPFSPEFFFYSYIVFPAMATSNPFAWSTLPSGKRMFRRTKNCIICLFIYIYSTILIFVRYPCISLLIYSYGI